MRIKESVMFEMKIRKIIEPFENFSFIRSIVSFVRLLEHKLFYFYFFDI